MDVCFVALWMNHLNIAAVGCFETLLNNRLLLKGITFAKMYDISRQEPFCIKITWLINLTDVYCTHKNIDFPGHKHATLYDVNIIEGRVREYILSLDINLHLEKRVRDVEMEDHKIKRLLLSDESYVDGDVFIETTGTTGPMGNCLRYGNGCSMCVLRCPSFGPRISISERCGAFDIQGERSGDELGAMSGSCKLAKESLSEDIRKELNEKGVVVLKIPKEDVNYKKLGTKVCQQYALKEFAENIVLLDTGHAVWLNLQ